MGGDWQQDSQMKFGVGAGKNPLLFLNLKSKLFNMELSHFFPEFSCSIASILNIKIIMKRKFITVAFLAFGLSVFTSCSNDDDINSDEKMIDAQELPEEAQNFISTYFPTAEYSKVEKNLTAETDGTLYEVELGNNFEIDFDAEGKWIDIDGNDQELPTGIIPESIANYIAENYFDLFVTGIDTETTGYEIDLSNDLDLIFDSEENFVREDQ